MSVVIPCHATRGLVVCGPRCINWPCGHFSPIVGVSLVVIYSPWCHGLSVITCVVDDASPAVVVGGSREQVQKYDRSTDQRKRIKIYKEHVYLSIEDYVRFLPP